MSAVIQLCVGLADRHRHNYVTGFPTEKKSSGCSLKNINLARASSLTLTLLYKFAACVVAHTFFL